MKKVGIVVGILLIGLFAASIYFFDPSKKPEGTVTTNPSVVSTRNGLPEGESSASSTGVSTPTVVTPAKPEIAVGTEITADNIFIAINKERSSVGLKVLKRNAVLDAAAQAHLDDMFALNYFAHVSPYGFSYADFVKQAGYVYSYAGENLAVPFHQWTAQRTVQAWLASPTHYENIMKTVYSETGIAVREGYPCVDRTTNSWVMCTLVVQMFASPK